MGKIGSRFIEQERTKLQDVIPLDTPYLLFVDPSSVCNLRCVFCPCGGGNKDQWAKDKRVSMMPYEVYRKIIDDVAEFPHPLKTLRLYKEGEPLMNKRLPDMIHYARKKNVTKKIDFTTNGILLNEDLNFALMDAGVDRINISIEALDEDGYEKNAGARIDYKKFMKGLSHLYKNKGNCHIMMKISDVGLGSFKEEDFYNKFGDICDEMAIEHITPVWPGFDLSKVKKEFDEGIYGNCIGEIQICPYIFYSITVNSDASVSVCFVDWNHKHIVGNALENSLVDIWNGVYMNNIRKDNLLKKRKEYSICAQCGQIPYAALDNLDPYIDSLIKKYS